MGIFKTDTPQYRRQRATDEPAETSQIVCDWVSALFRTSTPMYRSKPAVIGTGPASPAGGGRDDVHPAAQRARRDW